MIPCTRPILCCLLLPGLALAAPAPENVLYRCRGSDGVTSFQQAPCGSGQVDAGRIEYQPDPPPPTPTQTAAPKPPEPEPAPSPAPTPAGPDAQAASRLANIDPGPSDAVECLRPDGSRYVRSGPCERSVLGGDKVEGYVLDEATGERVWMETVTPRREIEDPARPLNRAEACELARLQIAQIGAGKAPGGVFLRDAEQVRDRHCDREAGDAG